jgi:hypothetical protein
MILFGWLVMIDVHVYWGELQTWSIQSWWVLNWLHVIVSSKKNAIPNNNQAVRNHVAAMIKNDKSWYFPYPPTLSMSFSRGVNWKALSY